MNKNPHPSKTMWMFPKIVGFPPKSSILIGFSIIFTIHFGGNTPIFGNSHFQPLHSFEMLNQASAHKHRGKNTSIPSCPLGPIWVGLFEYFVATVKMGVLGECLHKFQRDQSFINFLIHINFLYYSVLN